jgi:hybrid cluster-associated redox disulfide protein
VDSGSACVRATSYLRWRKDGSAAFPYDVGVKRQVSGEWTVEETIRDRASAVSAFIRLKMHCVGCQLARFCTLEEVSRWYSIPLATLLEQLGNRVPLSSPEE